MIAACKAAFQRKLRFQRELRGGKTTARKFPKLQKGDEVGKVM